MNRRQLLKVLPAASVATAFLNGKPASAAFEIPTGRKIIIFVNESVIPLDIFAKIKLPVEAILCPVPIAEGQTIDDVIRIYEMPH